MPLRDLELALQVGLAPVQGQNIQIF